MTSTSRYSRYYTYIKPLVSSQVVKSYGVWTFSALTIIIFTIFAIKPTVETISTLQQKLQISQQTLEKVTQKVNNLSAGKQNYQQLGSDTVSKINVAVSTQIDLKGLIEPLEQAARANQASISALQIEPITISQKDQNKSLALDKIKFTFNTESNFNNLVKLLQQLQISPRLISIDSIVLNKAPAGSTILMSVTGRAYYLK